MLPREPMERYEFLRDRGRYLLYPRNDGDDVTRRDHVLVYGVATYSVPPGYVKVASFGPDKYLLSRAAR